MGSRMNGSERQIHIAKSSLDNAATYATKVMKDSREIPTVKAAGNSQQPQSIKLF